MKAGRGGAASGADGADGFALPLVFVVFGEASFALLALVATAFFLGEACFSLAASFPLVCLWALVWQGRTCTLWP